MLTRMLRFQGYCRLLICPFGTQQSQGECDPIFKISRRLSIRIQFGLTVVWSKNIYSFNNDDKSLKRLGENVINSIMESPDNFEHTQCYRAVCRRKLIMISDIVKTVSSDMINESFSVNEQISIDKPAFLYLVDISTGVECLLETFYKQVSKMSDKHIFVDLGDTVELDLYMSLFNENGHTFQTYRELEQFGMGCLFAPTITVKDKVCPKVGLRYSEFSKYVTESNRAIIGSLFKENQTRSDEVVDTCLDEYYDTMASVNLNIDAKSSTGKMLNIDVVYIFALLAYILRGNRNLSFQHYFMFTYS